MRLLPSDPDLQTIVARIKGGVIDLQPDFQRGEVWSLTKKKRLIDSVLRNWHVPPIHVVIVEGTSNQEVLDGQQRLVAIRDFVNGHFAVDGHIEPYDPKIERLHNLRYGDLPADVRNEFDQFTIRVFRLVDYKPDEPGELFFRLNQLTNLTAAEQRNAFYGPVRKQVKDLVHSIEEFPNSGEIIGFSNARMSYDDIIAKVLCTLENGTLAAKITAGLISDRFRSQQPFPADSVAITSDAVSLLLQARTATRDVIRFNKATLYSWILFSRAFTQSREGDAISVLAHFLSNFERFRISHSLGLDFDEPGGAAQSTLREELIEVFNDRASSRVSDVSSVIYRDFILWFFFYGFQLSDEPNAHLSPDKVSIIKEVEAARAGNVARSTEEFLAKQIDFERWGRLT